MNIILIIVGFYLSSADASHLVLNILHTNDVHSRFEMFSKFSTSCSLDKQKSGDVKTKCVGGVVRRSGFVRSFRQQRANVLLLDAGDQYQGSLWFHVFRGNLTRHFLNHMQYDAMALGNHEFDNGLSGLDPLLKETGTPILCSNLVKDVHSTALINSSVKPSVIVSRENRAIGIIGYLLPEVVTLSKTESLKFEDEIVAIRREVESLKQQGVNILIALGHAGFQRDQEIASAIPDLDIVIGGHSHTLLYNGKNPMNDKVEGPYPVIVTHPSSKTLVVTAGYHGAYIGVLNVVFDSDGKVTNHSGNPELIDDTRESDDNAQVYLNQVEGRVKALHSVVVGQTKYAFDANDGICRLQECTLGNLFADAVVEILHGLSKWQNQSAAIVNGGAVRASFGKGGISHGDLMTVLPFASSLVTLTITGGDLRKAFEHSVANFSKTIRHGKFLQVSGIKVQYNLQQPNGKRVVSLKIRTCFNCRDYEEVADSKMYVVAMPNFLANGGDGYSMKKDKLMSFDLIDTDIMIKYFKKHSPVEPRLENRITGMETYSRCGFVYNSVVVLLATTIHSFFTLD